MSEQKNFFDKLNEFIFGMPIPVLSENDLQVVRNLDQKMNCLLAALDSPTFASASEDKPQSNDSLNDLIEQVRKLAKTQFKANTLQETQANQQQETLQNLQTALAQQKEVLLQQQKHAVETAQLNMVKKLLPVMDSLDGAFNAGRRQVSKFEGHVPPEIHHAFISWLEGIRMARVRLLDLLAGYEVTPIVAVGELFDPHRHVAMGIDGSGRATNGTIVSEDRRGYTTPAKIIREAEVVVARSR